MNTNARGNIMQFIKDKIGTAMITIIIGVSAYLWGLAQEKGAAMEKLATIEKDMSSLKADVRELQRMAPDLKVQMSDLGGDIKALRAELRAYRR